MEPAAVGGSRHQGTIVRRHSRGLGRGSPSRFRRLPSASVGRESGVPSRNDRRHPQSSRFARAPGDVLSATQSALARPCLARALGGGHTAPHVQARESQEILGPEAGLVAAEEDAGGRRPTIRSDRKVAPSCDAEKATLCRADHRSRPFPRPAHPSNLERPQRSTLTVRPRECPRTRADAKAASRCRTPRSGCPTGTGRPRICGPPGPART